MNARAIDPLITRTDTARDIIWRKKASSASIPIIVKISALIADQGIDIVPTIDTSFSAGIESIIRAKGAI